jgi:hypothetical protein
MYASFRAAKVAIGSGCGETVDTEPRLMIAFSAARSLIIAIVGFVAGLVLAAMAVPMAARAAPPAQAAADSESRTISIVVYGDDPCPKADGDEIVVCARQPESERYRIPKRFRGQKAAQSPANTSWANKTRTLDEASRTAAGIPNTCSAVGTGGQSGCQAQFLAQSAAARRQQKDDDAAIPGNNPN